MNINNPGRALCTEDPHFDSYLPVDDQAFDQGVGPLTHGSPSRY